MMEDANEVLISVAAISDRGLSEKRPLNEDSFLADESRRIFAVADGVGGAQAGEVASKTAVEVLDEAFRHHVDDSDIEDLMEIAIQKANASIHRMAREHPKLAMMATTVVALHLDGRNATIGHVGDSRLYRLTPDGRIFRETADHSVVEEEVRAGRMTPAQAANHPSRNVISRALGAEDSVEVDLKTFPVEDGSAFLLCSDGITRHIPDAELRQLLLSDSSAEGICEELKSRCYQRGAEDNLTAVIVEVGSRSDRRVVPAALERTMSDGDQIEDETPTIQTARRNAESGDSGDDAKADPAIQAADGSSRITISTDGPVLSTGAAPKRKSAVLTILRALLLVVLLGLIPLAFYVGMRYQVWRAGTAVSNAGSTSISVPVVEDADAQFEKRRREIDHSPMRAIDEIVKETKGNPLGSSDPKTVYLYGRALLLAGRNNDAAAAFRRSIELLKDKPGRDHIRVETRLAAAVAALRSGDRAAMAAASRDIEEILEQELPIGGVPQTGIDGDLSTSGAASPSPKTSPPR